MAKSLIEKGKIEKKKKKKKSSLAENVTPSVWTC